MDGIGGLAGWRWIFILEGIVTVILSVITVFLLPADIQSASFLTEEEISFAGKRFEFRFVCVPSDYSGISQYSASGRQKLP